MKTFLKYRTFCPTFTGFMTDIPLNYDGHLACLCDIFSVSIGHYMSDVIRENVGHGFQNIGHMSGCPTTFHIHCNLQVGIQ